MQTNLQLDLAFNYLENTGTNIFLTGKAGTGKTTFLKKLKDTSPKRMIVAVFAGIPLGRHPGVAHDGLAVLRNTETQPAGLQRAFIDAQVVMCAVSDPSGVSTPFFALCGQN